MDDERLRDARQRGRGLQRAHAVGGEHGVGVPRRGLGRRDGEAALPQLRGGGTLLARPHHDVVAEPLQVLAGAEDVGLQAAVVGELVGGEHDAHAATMLEDVDAPSPLIVNLCPTGMVPRRAEVPALPVTPAQVAADVRRCRDAGAAIAHLHARGDDEAPTWERERFAELVHAVLDAAPDVVVCVTTSGRDWPEVQRRGAVLALAGRVKPEMASLTLGSMNFPTGPSVNAPGTIAALAARMDAAGIIPELEVFEPGMAAYARHLVRHGVLRAPLYANVLLGSLGTTQLSLAGVAACLDALPDGTTWALAGIGRFQLPAASLAIALGGHVRVGLEDNPWEWPARTPSQNARQVERVVRIAREHGREPATPAEARALIGLREPAGR